MSDQVLAQLERDRAAALNRLREWLAIPSVSTVSDHAADCRRAAQWTVEQLQAGGLQAQIAETDGHPVALGFTTPRTDAPTVLFYGHYDVQPPDPLDQWHSPPFEPTVRDGAVYARGASDDKGQVSCFLEALRAWREAEGGPPVNVTVLIEGEEECGSANLDPFLENNRDRLAADVVLISDTAMWGTTPAITYALRGLLYFDITLHAAKRDLHSGVYGGSVVNPANELTRVLGQLFDADRRVTIPGFYDDVVAVDEAERQRWADLPFDEAEYAGEVGLSPDALVGEAGYSTLERRAARPSCDINGLYGGYMQPGAKTIIPQSVGAKVSFRLAAEQDPDRIAQAFRDWLTDRTPPGCRWEITEHGRAHPVIVPTDSPWIAAAQQAMERGCGQQPLLVREGATIPVVSSFKRLLGSNSVLMGFGRHDDNIHAPNEKFELACFEMGCRSHAAFLDAMRR